MIIKCKLNLNRLSKSNKKYIIRFHQGKLVVIVKFINKIK